MDNFYADGDTRQSVGNITQLVKWAEPKWTTTPPTEPGWYWATHDYPNARPWVVFIDKSGYVVVPGFIHKSAVEPFTHWLGPLPVPEPPN